MEVRVSGHLKCGSEILLPVLVVLRKLFESRGSVWVCDSRQVL